MTFFQQSIYIGEKEIIFYLFSARREENPNSNYEIYDQSYFLWKQNWNHYFNIEHDDKKTIYSDDFTSHDECLSIFYQGECIASCLFKNFYTDDPTTKDDHYFSTWNDFFLKSIFKKNNLIKVCTYFSVKEAFKKDQFDISIKKLLCTAILKVFLDSSATVMLGTMRTKRSMGKLGAFYGGKIIESDKVHHYHADNKEELVDLVLFDRETSLENYRNSQFFPYIEEQQEIAVLKKAA